MSARRGPRPTGDRLRRLLVMLPWLMERGEVSVAEMCRRFELSEQELVKDLELAAMCGLLVWSASHASLQRTDTKLLAHGPFLERLRDQGRECGQSWIEQHGQSVGRDATVDLHRWFG